jgi:CcmD family protein
MDGFLIAYLVVWIGVGLYIGRLGAEQRRLSRALETLRLQIEASEKQTPPATKAA